MGGGIWRPGRPGACGDRGAGEAVGIPPQARPAAARTMEDPAEPPARRGQCRLDRPRVDAEGVRIERRARAHRAPDAPRGRRMADGIRPPALLPRRSLPDPGRAGPLVVRHRAAAGVPIRVLVAIHARVPEGRRARGLLDADSRPRRLAILGGAAARDGSKDPFPAPALPFRDPPSPDQRRGGTARVLGRDGQSLPSGQRFLGAADPR